MYEQLHDQLKESHYIRKSMKVDESDSGYERWRKKPVLKTRDLLLYENFNLLLHKGPGTMHRDSDRSISGKGSVRLDTPTSTAVKSPNNRRYAEPGIMYPLVHENLYAFNRISLWVYVDSPGFSNHFVMVALHNEGEHINPVPGRFEGSHHGDVVPGQWTQIIWELPDIYRDNVTGISVYTFLPGSPMNASEHMSIYLDDLRLETVEPEKSRGFDLNKDSIAYCHSGYLADARKQALVQHVQSNHFTLTDEKGAMVYTGQVVDAANGFGLLDFSDFRTPGFYTIKTGEICSKAFPIGPDAFLARGMEDAEFLFYRTLRF